jgi:hypothetical protein
MEEGFSRIEVNMINIQREQSAKEFIPLEVEIID